VITTLIIPVLAAVLAQPEPDPALAPPEPMRRVLVDRTLAERPVQLLAIDAGAVRVVDAQGRSQAVPRAEVLAILPDLPPLDAPVLPEPRRRTTTAGNDPRQPAAPSTPLGRLELTDGQVLPGSFGASTPRSKDSVVWASRLWGNIDIPLDHVAAIITNPERFDALMAGVKGTQDTVLLRNGDRVEGFLESVTPALVRIEKGGKVSDLPGDRIDGIMLANPVKPGGGAWAWVSGAASAISDITLTDTGSCTIAARLPGVTSQPTATITGDVVEGVCFDAAKLRPLAGVQMTAADAANDTRRWSQPPIIGPSTVPLGAADIELPGPMRVEWTLPRGVARIATTIEMPPSARLWGDCEVIVEVIGANGSGTQLARAQLNQSSPSMSVNAPLTNAAKLRVTVDQGPSGPIQDRVVLRRGLLLVQ